MNPPRLTDHDQLLVNLAGGLVAMAIPTADEVERDLALIAEVLPRVSRDAVLIRDLAAACEDLVMSRAVRLARDPGAQAPWHRAWFNFAVAVEKMMRWRATAVRQRLRQAEGARP